VDWFLINAGATDMRIGMWVKPDDTERQLVFQLAIGTVPILLFI
jgi:hypothetical protein